MSTIASGAAGPDAEADRLNSVGLALLAGRNASAARRAYRQAIALSPGLVQGLGNLANLEADDEALALAVLRYRRALAIAPGLAGLHLMLGTALLRSGSDESGERSLTEALALNPGYQKAYFNLGIHMLNRRRLPEAEQYLRRALESDPNAALALAGLSRVLSQQSRSVEARSMARRSVALTPSSPESLSGLGHVAMAVGHVAAATRTFRRALAVSSGVYALKDLMIGLHYDPEASSSELYALHRRWGELQAKDAIVPSNRPDPERRLKIGYLSADLYDHPVGRTVVGLIERHDSDLVETYAYAEHDRVDAVAALIKSHSRVYRSTVGLSDRAVADMVCADGIDILAVLAGHTQSNRIGVAALRPAPVQVSFYDLSTSGLPTMDYVVGDGVAIPIGSEERFCEAVVRLPSFFLHTPIEDVPIRASGAGPLTFGSCSNPSKLNDRVIRLWAGILNAVPDARLILKYHKAFADPGLAGDFSRRFEGLGIDSARIAFDGRRLDGLAHLAVVGGFDIALDPFPFNGCTTTYEALWMGIPVITLAGRRFLGRMGASMLHQIGLDDLAVADEDAYMAAACKLARDVDRRLRLRHELRDRLKASPLLDAGRYARSVEHAYRTMWRNWCRLHS